MNETQWATTVKEYVNQHFNKADLHLEILQGALLPYANEIVEYKDLIPNKLKPVVYETDLMVIEKNDVSAWKPRVVIECKIESITTHDAITYSEKAFAHKRVHPYLRYGILLGNRHHYSLPGRLFRHGLYFDFMASWVAYTPTQKELSDLLEILMLEVEASRNLEEMLYESRSSSRKRYAILHKPLLLKESPKSSDSNQLT